MNKKSVQALVIASITALAIIFTPDEGPVPGLRYMFAGFFAVLQGTLFFMWLTKAESSAQQRVNEIKAENQKIQRESLAVKSSMDEYKSKVVKSSTMVASLGAIAKVTGQTLDLDKLLGSIMDTLGSMGASRASIWLLNESAQRLELASAIGWPDAEKEQEVAIGEGIVGWVAQSGNSADPQTVQRDPMLLDARKRARFPTVMCVPLINNQERLGALNVESWDTKKGRTEGFQEEMRLIAFLGSLAAMSIKNAKIFGTTKEFAEKDGLTGLFNHRYYQDTMDRELKRADRYGDPVSILLTDIDKFKSFNDTYGHQVGDEVLAQTARLMAKLARESDIACRYGGEEFVLILPQTAKPGAAQLAERIRSSIEGTEYETEKGRLRVTMSVGVSTFPDDARKKDLLVKLADEALYRAKESGRNRVELARAEDGEKKPEAAAEPAPAAAAAAAPQSGRSQAEVDQQRLAQAQAAAITKARALAQAGNRAAAMEAMELARRIATKRTKVMSAVAADPELAARAQTAARIAAQRQATGQASEQGAADERAARARRTAAQPSVPARAPEGGAGEEPAG